MDSIGVLDYLNSTLAHVEGLGDYFNFPLLERPANFERTVVAAGRRRFHALG
jgi:hypothetical protein